MAKDNVRDMISKSEDVIGHMWDRCLADTIVKSAGGIALGTLASLLFFKRRPWPVVLGGGYGLGMGVANCNNDHKAIVAKSPVKKQTADTQILTDDGQQ